MYDELVKELRHIDEFATEINRPTSGIFREAADAIEELDNWWAQADKLIKMLEMPRWIPVTERLPEECEPVLAYIERNAWNKDGDRTRKRECAVASQCDGHWHSDGVSGVVCLGWMPLPEPPKEEDDSPICTKASPASMGKYKKAEEGET